MTTNELIPLELLLAGVVTLISALNAWVCGELDRPVVRPGWHFIAWMAFGFGLLFLALAGYLAWFLPREAAVFLVTTWEYALLISEVILFCIPIGICSWNIAKLRRARRSRSANETA